MLKRTNTLKTEESQIHNLARQIDQGFQEGQYQNWADVWNTHKSTIGTLSIQMSIPTGQVVAEILDAIETLEI